MITTPHSLIVGMGRGLKRAVRHEEHARHVRAIRRSTIRRNHDYVCTLAHAFTGVPAATACRNRPLQRFRFERCRSRRWSLILFGFFPRSFSRPVLDDLNLLQRHQALLHHLVDVGQQEIDFLARIDDFDDDRQIFR